MVDFHSHVLPNIDDGSSSIEESLELLRISKEQGIDHIVATPHFYAESDNPKHFLERRQKAFEELKRASKSTDNLPEIALGAEVSYFEGISDCDELKQLAIADTPLLLLEMPICRWNSRMTAEISAIYEKNGLIPLIAHIDRYINLLHDKHIGEQLAGLPVLIQANANFFISKKTQRLALKMLKKEQIHLLGSDCHNLQYRCQNLQAAAEIINGKLGINALKRISDIEKRAFSCDCAALEEFFI